MSVWFNGEILESASVDASNAGSLLGWGVFTTIGVRGGRPILLNRHYARLARDAGKAGIDLEWTWEQFATGISDLLQINNVQDGLARATLTKHGDGRWNTDSGTDLLILTHTTPPISLKPIYLWFPEEPTPSLGILSGVKTTSYLPYVLAWQQAQTHHCHDTLLITPSGFVCETARSNIFWVEEDIIYTPALSTGCLQGVGREHLIELGAKANLEIREVTAPFIDLRLAEEAFIISAATGPRPVESIVTPHTELCLSSTTLPMARKLLELWDSSI